MRKKFIMSQDIFDRIRGSESIKAGFAEIAAETGYSTACIKKNYYRYKVNKYGSKKDIMSERKKVLIKKVSENPDNLHQAFKEVAEQFNWNFNAVRSYYYIKIKKSVPVFNIISKKSGDFNVKNNHKDKYTRKITTLAKIKEWWNTITETIKNI